MQIETVAEARLVAEQILIDISAIVHLWGIYEDKTQERLKIVAAEIKALDAMVTRMRVGV